MTAKRLIRFPGNPPAAARRGTACLLVACSVAGCRDSATDPLATLMTEETAPALEVEIALPTLADLAARTGTEARLASLLRVWTGSQEAPDGPALDDAELAIAEAAPVLADALGPGGVTNALAPLHQALRSLEELPDVPERLAPELEEARRIGAASHLALSEGRMDEALRDGLIASDRLRALGPETVARVLVARGEAALQRTSDGGVDPASTLDVRRGTELLQRARRALDDGDYPRAIQRAYYAAQLIEGTGSRH